MIADSAVIHRLDQCVTARMRELNTPGLVLALTDRAQTLHVATYGYADLAAQQSVASDMVFEIGSIGKSFTALAVLQLVEAGVVDLAAPVATYLPWFAGQSAFAPITVHHLLSHTAGLSSGTDFTPSAMYEPYALRELTAAYAPGEHFHYSNVGYKTLGYLLEAVLGQPYREILQTRILDPLGMTETDAITTHATRDRLPTGYVPRYDDRPYHKDLPLVAAPWLEYSCADGSPATTIADLAIYLRMVLNRGAGIITAASFARMSQEIAQMGAGRSYGYGLISEDIADQQIIGHGGGTVGYRSVMLGNLAESTGVVAMSNGACDLYGIARFGLDLLHAVNLGLPLPEVPVSNPHQIPHAADYARIYGGGLTVVAEDDTLYLDHAGTRTALEQRGPDAFYAPHPAFQRFLLRFARQGERITAAYHGATWYPAAGVPEPVAPAPPPEWLAYPGQYRSHNPWFSNFTVVLRQGELVLITPQGAEDRLRPLDEHWFRVGDTPEQVRFDAIVAGLALRATYSGGDYYRQNT